MSKLGGTYNPEIFPAVFYQNKQKNNKFSMTFSKNGSFVIGGVVGLDAARKAL